MNKARLRQNILNGEQDIEALSDGLQNHNLDSQQQQKQQRFQPAYLQHQQQQLYNQTPQPHTYSINSTSTGNNYDFTNGGTPFSNIPQPIQNHAVSNGYNNNAGSRKSSLTSQSTVNKFFRRNKHADANFDDDTGADIQDLTNGNVSFDDITHIRNRGPYGIASSQSLDTAPIIPTLNSMNSSFNPTKANNIQYRKQMNQQKKMAMLNGARANSLANGVNPMYHHQQQQPLHHQDPRTLTMNYPRTMSLQSGNGSMPPRNMSMGNRMNPMYPSNMNSNPRAMSLRNGPPPSFQQQQPQFQPQQFQLHQSYNQQMSPGMPPRAMSLMSNGHLQSNQQPPYQNQMYNQNSRNNSLGGNYNQPILKSNNLIRGDPQQYIQQQGQQIQQQGQQIKQQPPPQLYNQSFNSSDSLKDVPEEDEEAKRDEEDVIYKFDDNGANNLSRKSTMKKNNSMKVRKLNLFNDAGNNSSTSVGRKAPPISPIEPQYQPQKEDLDGEDTNSSSNESYSASSSSHSFTTVGPNKTTDTDLPSSSIEKNLDESKFTQQRQVSNQSLPISQSSYKIRENTAFNNFNKHNNNYNSSRSDQENRDTTHIIAEEDSQSIQSSYDSLQQQAQSQARPATKRSTSISSQLSKLSKKDKPSFFKRLSFSSKKKDGEPEVEDVSSSNSNAVSLEEIKSLQQELANLSKEFASSIRREILLENLLKEKGVHSSQNSHLYDELCDSTAKSSIIAELENKLSHQRHINMNQDAPKTQIYQELLEKNDQLSEMKEKIQELQSEKSKNLEILHKFDQLNDSQQHLHPVSNDLEIYTNEIKYLKGQKDELIETVNKLKSELEIANKNKEYFKDKLNQKLSGPKSNKINGFTIVSPNRKSFLVNE